MGLVIQGEAGLEMVLWGFEPQKWYVTGGANRGFFPVAWGPHGDREGAARSTGCRGRWALGRALERRD